MYKISSQSVNVDKSYRVYDRTDTVTDAILYSAYEYTKGEKSRQISKFYFCFGLHQNIENQVFHVKTLFFYRQSDKK